MILGGFLTALGFIVITIKISPQFTKILLGYEWFVDIIMTLTLITLFAMSQTASGMMVGIVAGLTISLSLFLGRRLYGYSKIHRNGRKFNIKTYPPIWTIDSWLGD